MSLDKGSISWEVVNTRNVNNVRIEVDDDPERETHNGRLCEYIVDQEKYDQYFDRVCRDLGYKKFMTTIDCTFHPFSLDRSTRELIKKWEAQTNKIDFTDDNAIERILAHDGNRSFLLHAIRRHRNSK